MPSENWTSPPLLAAVKDPTQWQEWRRRCDQWEAENPEINKAWKEALWIESQRVGAEADRRAEISRLIHAGVPARTVDVWVSGPDATPAVESVRSWLKSGKNFLLLLGKPGGGKTVAASQALVDGGEFARAVELSRTSAFDKEDQRQFRMVCRTRMLVLDDLGAEMLHDGWRPLLDELVDVRYGDRLRTIITSNLDGQGFKARYGERISDRIRHDGEVFMCGDKSLRSPL